MRSIGAVAALAAIAIASASTPAQKPLGSDFTTFEIPPLGKFTKFPVVEPACPSHGEAQFTGLLSISEGHSIYYWSFDSRNDPENDPVIFWMQGGPGASSMAGIFTEVGPCFLQSGEIDAKPNPWSWNTNATVVFLDQPVGMGFSHFDPSGGPMAGSEKETAKDFEKFLNMFFADVFPEKKHLPIHIASEGYGGHYGPVYLDHIIKSRKEGSDTAFYGNITSLVLISPIVDWTDLAIGAYELVCEEKAGLLNDSECVGMQQALSEQKKLGHRCFQEYGGEACREAYNHAQEKIHAPYMKRVNANQSYIGDVSKTCDENRRFPHCTDPDMGNYTAYMNQGWVKEALSKPPGVFFSPFSKKMYESFHNSSAYMSPTVKELSNVLDYEDQSIRVLVLNGKRDYLANTLGNIKTFDKLHWAGAKEYKGNEWAQLSEDVAPGEWKATKDGHLVFVALDDAGHMVPLDEKEATFRIIQTWLEGRWTI